MSPRNQHALVLAMLTLSACGGGAATPTTTETTGTEVAETPPPPERHRQEPPPSGAARDVHLPAIARSTLRNGLEINTVNATSLPVVYVRLTVRSGLSADPQELPGLSVLVAKMLKEGTRTRTSAQIAEEFEYLGADFDVFQDAGSVTIQARGLSDQLDTMLALMADMAMNPRFDQAEFDRLRRREADRLTLQYGDPSQLARREFYRALYGPSHPYGHVDLSPATLEHATRADLVSWHAAHFVPNNAFLVVAGNVEPAAVQTASEHAFGRWRQHDVPAVTFPELPARTTREVIVVHRPGSAQSMFNIGNLSIRRADPDFIALEVANEVLGGSPRSRLFMDLREQRSLTYGVYSSLDDLVQPGPYRVRGSVGPDPAQPQVDRTGLAMDAFMEHLHRITTEPASATELDESERYLSDSFPLSIDTAGRIAWMVGYLRIFGLPDDYWDGYRSQIRAITPEQALAAARAHITPDTALVLVVGDADRVVDPLRHWGPVHVIDTDGNPIASFPLEGAAPSAAPAAAPAADAAH
jgi:predicted Zn-dependent peptidase